MKIGKAFLAPAVGLIALASAEAAIAQARMAPANPACPADPNWSDHRAMQFTAQEVEGRQVLLAEGSIDDALIPRLQSAIDDFEGEEVWLRSNGGNNRIAREAGIILKHSGVTTRVRAGAACAGACTFMFMGGVLRTVEPGGYLMLSRSPNASEPRHVGARASTVEQTTALEATEVSEFLIHVGISRNLFADLIYRQDVRSPGEPSWFCLTRDELDRYNVTPHTLTFDAPNSAGEAKP